MTNKYFANKIRDLRESKGLLQRHLAALLEIDTPMYSRIERGERLAKEEYIPILAEFYKEDVNYLRQLWLADKVYNIIYGEGMASEVLGMVAEDISEYGNENPNDSNELELHGE